MLESFVAAHACRQQPAAWDVQPLEPTADDATQQVLPSGALRVIHYRWHDPASLD